MASLGTVLFWILWAIALIASIWNIILFSYLPACNTTPGLSCSLTTQGLLVNWIAFVVILLIGIGYFLYIIVARMPFGQARANANEIGYQALIDRAGQAEVARAEAQLIAQND